MQLMVRALLSMSETPEPADAADALAVALCHVQREQARRRFTLPEAVSLQKSRGVRLAVAAAGSAARNPLPRIQ
jgi:crossover junction endodeoxyribonuclease RuvC